MRLEVFTGLLSILQHEEFSGYCLRKSDEGAATDVIYEFLLASHNHMVGGIPKITYS